MANNDYRSQTRYELSVSNDIDMGMPSNSDSEIGTPYTSPVFAGVLEKSHGNRCNHCP